MPRATEARSLGRPTALPHVRHPHRATSGPNAKTNRFRNLASSVRRLAVSTGASVDEVGLVNKDFVCDDDTATCEVKTVPKKKQRDRLVCRIDDRWVDLTGWRNAHPAGTHWIDLYDKADATEVMHGFHSGEAMKMLSRLPAARPEDVPSEEVCPTPTKATYAFRELRTKLEEEGWFKRNAVGEAGHLLGWCGTMAAAIFAAKSGNFVLSAVMLAVSNTGAGWIAHDYTHGRGKWCSFMRGFGELCGGMSTTWWSDKHNLHHALTNVVGIDEDLMVDPALFLWQPSPENDNWLRKIQHWYWALPYSMLFAIWRIDSVKVAMNRKLNGELFRLAAHYAIWAMIFPVKVLLPAVFLSGLLTATIVTVSHISEDLFFDGPHKVDYVEAQLRSTRDFKCSNPVFEYLSGGMNYQIEHHLFPIMPRYKYPALQKVLMKFAAEHNIEYRLDGDWQVLRRTINNLQSIAKADPNPNGPPSRDDSYPTLPAI
mmetsp:Transcript_44961/g.123279  ORF Transcript_44961/g.123279 Transcript_44961/m.123279 type:complete len:484 (+) Transcript_44961:270-1721(+)